jgi:hypothetical protein
MQMHTKLKNIIYQGLLVPNGYGDASFPEKLRKNETKYPKESFL